ncbi:MULTISPECIES: hypothetical protein [Niastella]|uniref:2TM domain-containing protein n=1 Tax=Niastella soli TaxID=2821487 RepID=A0ABS3YWZ9_9BACT|nr:hypothetical protein [Niastella soli]MBO9202032.1 hypothetical protein [Niastella soli]
MNKLSAFGALIVVIAHIALIILCGVWAWSWVGPESFWGGVKFIFIWGIFDYIAHLVIMTLAVVLFNNE